MLCISVVIQKVVGEFGYNCVFGNCYGIPSEEGERVWIIFHESIALPITCGIIFISYSYILYYMKNSHKFLLRHGTRQVNS